MKTTHNLQMNAFWDNGHQEEHMRLMDNESQTTNSMGLKWAEIQYDYRYRYPELINEDLSYGPDQFDTLTQHIAHKTFRTPEEVREEIQNWQPSLYTRYDR